MNISVIMPVFNSMRTLESCLESIFSQDYSKGTVEIIAADAGSSDGTRELLENYEKHRELTGVASVKVISNPLVTGEAGKAAAVKEASGDILAFIDSDNILPSDDWLEKMILPFELAEIVASEPIEYTYRKSDSYINRYCALTGMNDCLCAFTGNYDRMNTITGRWTEVEREEVDMGEYLALRFKESVPTMGANGFAIRRKALTDVFAGEYLFDIDVLCDIFEKNGGARVAKVKTGIIHLFCDDIKTYIRKQKRRIRDYRFFNGGGNAFVRIPGQNINPV